MSQGKKRYRTHDLIPCKTSALSKLGGLLKTRREHLQLEIKEVAEEANCSTVFVSRLERGLYDSAQIAKIEAVCKVLGYRLVFTLTEN